MADELVPVNVQLEELKLLVATVLEKVTLPVGTANGPGELLLTVAAQVELCLNATDEGRH